MLQPFLVNLAPNLLKVSRALFKDDQVLSLPSNTPIIVPSPGENRFLIPLFMHLRCSASVDFATIDATCTLTLGTTGIVWGVLDQAVNSSISGLLAPGDPDDAQNSFIIPNQRQRVTSDLNGLSGVYDSDIVDKPLILTTTNGGVGDFTIGEGILTVSTVYLIKDIATGLYITE